MQIPGKELCPIFLVEIAQWCLPPDPVLTVGGQSYLEKEAPHSTGPDEAYIPQHIIQVLGHHPCQVEHHHG